MSFTRKHYEGVARIFRAEAERLQDLAGTPAQPSHDYFNGHRCALRNAQSHISAIFAADNPRFDAERFAKACEPGSGK